MRIAIDYTPAVYQRAGIGRHTRGLVQALAELNAGHQITLVVYGRPPKGAPQAPAECNLRIVPLPNRWMTVAWHRMRAPLPADWLIGAIDLYHASDFVLPPLRQAKALVTVHDLSFLTVPEGADAGLRSFLSRVVPRAVARADHVLADSKSTKRDLVERLGLPEQKITVVYPGVEPRFRPVADPTALATVRARYRIGDAPFVLGVGTLEPRKNWTSLIRAWSQMRKAHGLPHRLVIAGGRGWLYEKLFQEVATSEQREHIVLPGFVEDSDLPALYSAADVFAFPSLYEGFGIPVVEAMACGTPVVCADNSSLPEAAGLAALLVPATDSGALADAMARIITDATLRSELCRQGLRHARRFTWTTAARTLLDTYERVECHG